MISSYDPLLSSTSGQIALTIRVNLTPTDRLHLRHTNHVMARPVFPAMYAAYFAGGGVSLPLTQVLSPADAAEPDLLPCITADVTPP